MGIEIVFQKLFLKKKEEKKKRKGISDFQVVYIKTSESFSKHWKVDPKPKSFPYFKTEAVHLHDFELQHDSYIVQVHIQDISVFTDGRNESSAIQQECVGTVGM